MLKLHSLKPSKGSKFESRRVGRGPGSGRGKTAGRGTKGQKARTGGRNKLRLKGMKFITARLPKLRGFKSHFRKPEAVTLKELNEAMPKGGFVNPNSLFKAGLVTSPMAEVKILGSGEAKGKWTVKGVKASGGAKAAIEKAGGSFI